MAAKSPMSQADVAELAKVKAGVKTLEKKTTMLMKSFPGAAQLSAATPAAVLLAKEPVTVTVASVPGESASRTAVSRILKNDLGSALVMKELVYADPTMQVLDLCAVLREQGEKAEGGDLAKLEGTLAIQAIVLDGIFTNFARRAAVAKNTDDLERMLRIALKAQSQCRTTVESLAVIQQGPAIFAKQANVNRGGQQQVNNGVPAPNAPAAAAIAPRVRERKQKAANQTIGRNHG
jgi:hypothetical protein